MTASFKGKLIAGFVLAFLAGGAAGVFFTFHQARHWRADFGRHPHSLTERMRDRIKGQLDLTPQQLAKIEPILDRAAKELQEIRAETGAKVRQVMAETNHALQPELTEPQRARLEKIQQAGGDRKDFRKSSRRRGPHAADEDGFSPED
jgi:Spy/CpxP family protein refolding chaperone